MWEQVLWCSLRRPAPSLNILQQVIQPDLAYLPPVPYLTGGCSCLAKAGSLSSLLSADRCYGTTWPDLHPVLALTLSSVCCGLTLLGLPQDSAHIYVNSCSPAWFALLPATVLELTSSSYVDKGAPQVPLPGPLPIYGWEKGVVFNNYTRTTGENMRCSREMGVR